MREVDSTASEFWHNDLCFRYDPEAQSFGRSARRVYRLVGVPGYSFSYDPERPWNSVNGSTKTGARCAEVTALRVMSDVVSAQRLVNAYDALMKSRS